MKIKVASNGRRFTIPLPNGLILNGLTAKIASSCLHQYADIDIPEPLLTTLCNQLKDAKALLNGLPLVYVHSKDGEIVEIWM